MQISHCVDGTSPSKYASPSINKSLKKKTFENISPGVLADLDPLRIGPPGPNPLADMDPPVHIR